MKSAHQVALDGLSAAISHVESSAQAWRERADEWRARAAHMKEHPSLFEAVEWEAFFAKARAAESVARGYSDAMSFLTHPNTPKD